MTNGQITAAFFAETTKQTVDMVLENIAGHYGITKAAALDEVTDDEAESLLDYVTGPERMATLTIMRRHKLHA